MKPRILVIGDSFVEGVGATDKIGWAQSMENSSNQVAELVVSGIGGDTIVKILDRHIEFFEMSFEKVVLAVGLNDSRYRPSKNANEVPRQSFIDGIRQFVELWQSKGAKVYLIGLTRVDEDRTDPYKEDKIYRNALVEDYDECLVEVAVSTQATYVAVSKLNDLKEGLCDGLHPSDLGHQKLLSCIEGAILS